VLGTRLKVDLSLPKLRENYNVSIGTVCLLESMVASILRMDGFKTVTDLGVVHESPAGKTIVPGAVVGNVRHSTDTVKEAWLNAVRRGALRVVNMLTDASDGLKDETHRAFGVTWFIVKGFG